MSRGVSDPDFVVGISVPEKIWPGDQKNEQNISHP
jgi:hypothetical protein